METQIERQPGSRSVDQAQREQLVLDQLSHVRFVARRIHCRLPSHILLEDLVHAGIVGLLDAVEKYNPARNVKLKAYAEFRIRGAILDSLREGDWSPRALRREARRLEKAISGCEARLGRAPTEQEIAAELDVSLDDLQSLARDINGLEIEDLQNVLINREISRADLRTSAEDDPFSKTARAEMRALLMNAIAELSERERQVLTLYHFKELPMKEVGSALGIGESRVSQIHSTALLRLREQLADAMASAASGRNS